jgi:hypothetical protein
MVHPVIILLSFPVLPCRKENSRCRNQGRGTFNSTVTNNIVGCIVYKRMVLVPAAVEVLVFEIRNYRPYLIHQ